MSGPPTGKTAGASGNDTGKALSWILLSGFLFIANLARGVYAAHDSEPSPRFQLLTAAGFMGLLWYWFVQQLEPYRPRLPMDMGIFWRYERWRGVGKVVGLAAVYGLSSVFGAVTAFVLS